MKQMKLYKQIRKENYHITILEGNNSDLWFSPYEIVAAFGHYNWQGLLEAVLGYVDKEEYRERRLVNISDGERDAVHTFIPEVAILKVLEIASIDNKELGDKMFREIFKACHIESEAIEE